ncbi:MAG: hypothetical protein E7137_03590 [Rikenellaceae bacterium]|nr:hypothetical protein [Rikenellaceae bacterium]
MKNILKLSFVLVAAALVFSSCNCFKKMAKNREDIQVTCTPEVLELTNGIVAADISVTIPAKYFNAKAVVKVTPVIVFEGGEVAGTPKYFQGEKVEENYTVVSKKSDGVYTLHAEFPYDERMKVSELQVRAEIKCPKGGCKELTLVNLNTGAVASEEELALMAQETPEALAMRKAFGLTVAQGVNVLQGDLNFSTVMIPMPNNYKKVTTEVVKVDIIYDINNSKVSKVAVKGLDGFKADVDEKAQNDRATQHLTVKGYASPDGPEQYNDKLSKARSESGKKALEKLLEGTGLEVDAAAYGEDWEGLKELVAASDIKDKNLILQVLGLYSSSAQREAEIKNMATVFEELKSDVLPKLRRSQVVNSTDIQGKTDEEIMALINAGDFNALGNEELLYAAESLITNGEQKVATLSHTAQKYNDLRAYNNLGIALSEVGQQEAALKAFEKAAQLGSTNSALSNNLALSNMANGKMAEADKYLQAADADAKAMAAAVKGDYSSAAKQLEGANAAIAYIMNKDYTAAKNAIAKDNSADADYLRAVIAKKEGDLATAKAQLNSAIAKNPALAQKAASDVNLKGLE